MKEINENNESAKSCRAKNESIERVDDMGPSYFSSLAIVLGTPVVASVVLAGCEHAMSYASESISNAFSGASEATKEAKAEAPKPFDTTTIVVKKGPKL